MSAEPREIPFVAAINEALHLAMERDPKVIVLGEDIAGGGGRSEQGIEDAWGGILGATRGLIGRFGTERVIDTPISEAGFLGMAVGAAATGLRPVVDMMFMDFLGVCLDPLMNQAAKLRYMFGGKARVPLVVRTIMGAGLRAAAQHSQSLHALTTSIPGLKTVVPANAHDAKGLLLASIEDDDPVIFCEPKSLYFSSTAVPEQYYTVAIGTAALVRKGSDASVVACGKTVETALAAAVMLAKEGLEVEIVDLRSLSPIDEDTILSSLEKTGYLVVADEGTPRCSIASDIAALAVDRGFDFLQGPVRRVTAPHTPVPFSPVLEDAYLPSANDIAAAVRSARTT